MGDDAIQNRWYELLRVTRSWRLEWNLDQLLQRVAREAVEFLAFDRGIIFLLGREGVTRRAVFSKSPEQLGETPRDIQSIAEKVIHNGRAVFAHIVNRGAAGETGADAPHENVGDACCVPLTAGRGILGALYVDSTHSARRDKQNQQVLEMLGLQAAAALEHAILYHSAITDPLTGLYSHRHFQQEVEQAVRRALRSDQKLSLLILDLDHFKALNDSEGHEVGNQCLVQVSELLRSTLRSADIIARFGGDEFEMLLPDTPLVDAVKVAEKLRGRIAKLRFGKNRRVAGTIGVAAFPQNAVDAQRLFLRADEALYQAKEGGRNRTIASTQAEKLPRLESLRAGLSGEHALVSAQPADETQPAEIGATIPEHVATEQIDGYSLLRRLGIGSMGEVLLVRQDELDREVALKRPLTPHLTKDQVDAFEREARITASLNHPGVISVFALGRDSDGRRYYTMRPLNGMSLAEILERKNKQELKIARTYGLSRLLEVIQRVAETIAYAHQREIFHLDLTPANVVLGEFGEVTVIDWGTSATSTSARMGVNYHLRGRSSPNGKLTFLVGSAGSLAPEQLPGSKRRPNAATDVHALGALLYEVLTGRGPYDRDNTHDVLNAILEGTIDPPERAAPKAGIDPTLSLLCINALHKDSHKRPTAAEFAQRLGRYVRRETEFTVTRFGPHEHPLDLNEWKIEDGKWKIVDGELVTEQAYPSLILWKPSVPGAFRFAMEGWIEKQGEIAIVGRSRFNTGGMEGYMFQFGAEWNTCTKLDRFAAIVGKIPQPGRRYRLEMEYQEGWLNCYLDGEKVFEHRELFHFTGEQIGFYTCDAGVHFKPIEIQSQNWGLNIPAVRMADAYYQSGDFQKAAAMYEELSARMGERLEGLESRLKLGMCMASMQKLDEAVRIFRSLRKTLLESYAIAQEGLLEYRRQPLKHPKHPIGLFRQLASKHRSSPARFALIQAAYETPHCRSVLENSILRCELRDLARNSLPHPTMLEIGSHNHFIRSLMQLGQWKRALDENIKFKEQLLPTQQDIIGFQCGYMATALANGREDLLTADPFQFGRWDFIEHPWPTSPVFHVLVRQKGLLSLLQNFASLKAVYESRDSHAVTVLSAYVAVGKVSEAEHLFEQHFLNCTDWNIVHIALDALLDAGCRDAVDDYVPRLKASVPAFANLLTGFVAARAIQAGDFEGAARELSELPIERDGQMTVPPRIMLASLGALRYSAKEMNAWVQLKLIGIQRDLAGMFLGKNKPVPGKLWPHPGWQPQFRLMLGLWLEARGKKKAAHAAVLPSRDPRYGPTHAQPAIEALLKRTGGRGR